jgi:hypothetical protein
MTINFAVTKNRATGEANTFATRELFEAWLRANLYFADKVNIIGGSIRSEGYDNCEDYAIDFRFN